MNSVTGAARVTIFFIVVFLYIQGIVAGVQEGIHEKRLLSGRITDTTTGQAIYGATISVSCFDEITAANEDGSFTCEIPAAACTLTIIKSSYERWVVQMEAGAHDTTIEVAIGRSSVIDLQTMRVVARRNSGKQLMASSGKISRIEMSPELVAELPSAGQADLFRSLQLLPGVTGANELSSGLYVRGGTPDQNLIILDNMPIYYVDHFYGFFSAFNPRAIGEATLYKGGFGARWGGRLSGVVDLSSSGKNVPPDSNKVLVAAGSGLLSSDFFLRIPVRNHTLGTVMIAGRRSMTDMFSSDLFNLIFGSMHGNDTLHSQSATGYFGPRGMITADRIVYEPAFGFWDVNGCASFFPWSGGKLSTTVFLSRDHQDNSVDTTWQGNSVVNTVYSPSADYSQPETMPTDTISTRTNIDNRDIVSWGNSCIGQEWEQRWSETFASRLNLSYSHFYDKRDMDDRRTDIRSHRFSDTSSPVDSLYLVEGRMLSMNRITDLSCRFDHSLKCADWNTVNAGLEVSLKTIIYERDTTQPDTNSMEWKSWYYGQGRPQKPHIGSYDTGSSWAVYAEDEMTFGEKAGLSSGLRFYRFQNSSKYALDPRVSGWWHPISGVKVQAAWGTYTQEIHRAEEEDILGGGKFVWLLTTADRPLETSRQVIAGISFDRTHVYLDAEGYVKRFSGLLTISERLRSEQWSLRNKPFDPDEFVLFEGSGTARGIDLLAQAKNVRFPFMSSTAVYNGWIAYTLSSVQNTYAVFNNGASFPATHDHTHEIKVVNSFDWHIASWTTLNLGAVWIYATGAPYTAPLGYYSLELLGSYWARSYLYVSDKNTYRLPDYHRLDLSASWKATFGQCLQSNLTIGLFNAYDHENILERSYTEFELYGYGYKDGLSLSGPPASIFTRMDRKAMAIMPYVALDVAVKF